MKDKALVLFLCFLGVLAVGYGMVNKNHPVLLQLGPFDCRIPHDAKKTENVHPGEIHVRGQRKMNQGDLTRVNRSNHSTECLKSFYGRATYHPVIIIHHFRTTSVN